MEATKKRSLKKRLKVLNILSWITLGFFFLSIGFIIVSSSFLPKPIGQYVHVLIVVIPLVSFPFLSLIFMFHSEGCKRELIFYMNSIKKYRARKFGQKILELLILGETQKAVNLYKVTNMYENDLDDYLYGVIITECRLCSDEALKKVGEAKTAKLLNAFDPDKIKL
jgi:hypothetical protein